MKRYLYLFPLALLISVAGYAQTGGLKGPAAKNYKPWESPPKVKPILIATLDQDIKGPKAKNLRPLQRTEGTVKAEARPPREKRMGPAAKNYKPWKKD